jgi:hypothetical protein
MTFLRPLFFLCAFTPLFAVQNAAGLKPFLEAHCIDCHGEDKAKAGLRLDTLAFDIEKPENSKKWEEVFTRVQDREMPPPKKSQPDAKSRKAFTAELQTVLLAADNKRRADDGRVVLRRLNRNEYQNTMRDMLGVEVDLKGLLPEDQTALGFDNIGEALSVSSVLMERYLMAADTALDAILVKGPKPETKTWHLTMEPNNIRTPESNKGKWDYRLASGVRVLEDGTYIFFNSMFQPIRLEKFQAPMEGDYRFRVNSYATQSGGKPLTLEIFAGSFDTRSLNTRLVGLFDLPEDKPSVIEFIEHLPNKGSIRPLPYRLGQHNLNTPELVKAYTGPGIAIQSVDIEGPIIKDWPPVGYQRLLGDIELAKGSLADAEKALRWLAPRAFRRPVVDDDVQPFVALVKAALDAGKPFEEALRGGIKGMLCAPDFLFMKEKSGRLSDHDLATRLSYFLWSSAPDDALAKLAGQGKLHEAATLRAQVERMLKDERASRFTENFTGQWLGLRNIEFTTPDKKLYPEHDDALQDAMLKETRLFFTELLAKDLSVTNFVDSDFTIINERLAQHYGIDGVVGQVFRKVKLTPEMHRGGVLTQAAILKITANGTNTSPVIRGNWVLKNILGKPVKAPPPNVPAIEPDIRGAKSMREQVAKHRELESCAVCHDRMDPPGLALENYDVIGGWRTNYRSAGEGQVVKLEVEGRKVQYKTGLPVDASGEMPDGRTFKDIDGLKKLILADRAQVARCVTEKLLTYATGAGMSFADKVEIDSMVAKAADKNHGLRTLIHLVVQSRAFQSK